MEAKLLTLLFYLLALVAVIIAIPLAETVYARTHKARREGDSASMNALTSIFYTKPPTLVYEQESRQARKDWENQQASEETKFEEDPIS